MIIVFSLIHGVMHLFFIFCMHFELPLSLKVDKQTNLPKGIIIDSIDSKE